MKYLYLLILITLTSCTSGVIYDGSIEWKFTVKNSSIDRTDTLLFYRSESWYPKKLKWDFSFIRQKNKAKTSIESIFTEDSDLIKIGAPYGFYLNYTELVPHPEVRFPIKEGDLYESNHKTNTRRIKGTENVDDIDVEGKLEVVSKILYKQELLKDSSWVIDAEGNSSVGKFTSTYYYHEKYGFVYFKYNLEKDTIEIDLNQLSVTEKSSSKI